MPEFLTLLPPDQAREELLSHLATPQSDSESVGIVHALGRFTAADTFAPHPLPDFPRTTVDGYAVRAKDTFGASDSLPAYLTLIGEVPMGDTPSFELRAGQCALIHTGGMLPNGADAVVMVEYTQMVGAGLPDVRMGLPEPTGNPINPERPIPTTVRAGLSESKDSSINPERPAPTTVGASLPDVRMGLPESTGNSINPERPIPTTVGASLPDVRMGLPEPTDDPINPERPIPTTEIEIFKSVADGENVIRIGEDVAQGQLVIPKGTQLRPAEIGGLMALGITSVSVANKPRVGLISTGDEVIDPSQTPRPGQVRDINSYTLGALVEKAGGEAIRYGIFSDQFQLLKEVAAKALSECDVVIITAGSSASTRDMTADVIRTLGAPGVLVHGINTRPGKPTILGVCNGKAVIGLPGNPVSALVNGYLFVVPVIEKLLGALPKPKATVQATLTVNLPSQAGREDWWPVKLIVNRQSSAVNYKAEPIFGKSNLIFTLASADGLLRIHPDATGLSAGELVEVVLI